MTCLLSGGGRIPFKRIFGWRLLPLIRAHVIPRKMLFDPSKWITSQEDVKKKLMRALGPVRSTQAIACQSLRSLHALHDDWAATQSDGHVALWVGRTIFPRATPEHRFRGPDTGAPHDFNSEDALANDESGTGSRGYPPGIHRSPLMECRRDSSGLHRTPEGQRRCESYAQGTWLHESCTTQGAVCEARGGCSGEGGERTTPTTPSPNPLPTRRGGGELWPPCQQTVLGGTDVVPQTHDGRGQGEPGQLFARLDPPGDVCRVDPECKGPLPTWIPSNVKVAIPEENEDASSAGASSWSQAPEPRLSKGDASGPKHGYLPTSSPSPVVLKRRAKEEQTETQCMQEGAPEM